jgi:hypothetical protein
MDHLTLGALRALVERMAHATDDTEVRFYLSHDDRYHAAGEDWDDTFGRVVATIDSPEEDGTPPYLGFRLIDTGDLS